MSTHHFCTFQRSRSIDKRRLREWKSSYEMRRKSRVLHLCSEMIGFNGYSRQFQKQNNSKVRHKEVAKLHVSTMFVLDNFTMSLTQLCMKLRQWPQRSLREAIVKLEATRSIGLFINWEDCTWTVCIAPRVLF